MPDAADDACIHLVKGLERDDRLKELQWLCLDCGRVHAAIADGQSTSGRLLVWAARNSIPDAKIERYIRELEVA